jgi:hypothetical protein
MIPRLHVTLTAANGYEVTMAEVPLDMLREAEAELRDRADLVGHPRPYALRSRRCDTGRRRTP